MTRTMTHRVRRAGTLAVFGILASLAGAQAIAAGPSHHGRPSTNTGRDKSICAPGVAAPLSGDHQRQITAGRARAGRLDSAGANANAASANASCAPGPGDAATNIERGPGLAQTEPLNAPGLITPPQ